MLRRKGALGAAARALNGRCLLIRISVDGARAQALLQRNHVRMCMPVLLLMLLLLLLLLVQLLLLAKLLVVLQASTGCRLV